MLMLFGHLEDDWIGEEGLNYGLMTVIAGLAVLLLLCCGWITLIIAMPLLVIGTAISLFETLRMWKQPH